MESQYPHSSSMFRIALLVEGSVGLLATGLGWWLRIPFWEQISWQAPDVGWGVMASLPMLGLFALCWRLPLELLRRMRELTEAMIQPVFASRGVLELALVSLLAGVGEECLFRGVLQEAFAYRLGAWGGLILASMLFGLLHPITWTYILLATFMGVYLGWTLVATHNLLVPITAHAVYDFLALWILLRRAASS